MKLKSDSYTELFTISKESVANYYASSVSTLESFIGKALAIAIILFFVILAVLAAYFAWVHI